MVLKRVVESLKHNIRQTDMVFRFGGDEFVILFSGATREQLVGFFTEVDQEVRNLGISVKKDGVQRSLSVSMGAYLYRPKVDGELSSEDLLKRADNAVYTAKRSGKGQIYIPE